MLVFFFLALPFRRMLPKGLLSVSLPLPPSPEDLGLPARPGKIFEVSDECLLVPIGLTGVVVVLPVVVLNALAVGVVGLEPSCFSLFATGWGVSGIGTDAGATGVEAASAGAGAGGGVAGDFSPLTGCSIGDAEISTGAVEATGTVSTTSGSGLRAASAIGFSDDWRKASVTIQICSADEIE